MTAGRSHARRTISSTLPPMTTHRRRRSRTRHSTRIRGRGGDHARARGATVRQRAGVRPPPQFVECRTAHGMHQCERRARSLRDTRGAIGRPACRCRQISRGKDASKRTHVYSSSARFECRRDKSARRFRQALSDLAKCASSAWFAHRYGAPHARRQRATHL